jgi:hypothetical protein
MIVFIGCLSKHPLASDRYLKFSLEGGLAYPSDPPKIPKSADIRV